MITQRRQIGDVGEEKACRYLISKGYSILQRNYATKFGEIDILARKGGRIIFVEVKTGYVGYGIRPEENLTARKLGRFLKAVRVYLVKERVPDSQEWQIDGISVLLNRVTGNEEITHFENINIK